MSKNNVLVISECKYSYVGLSVLLKKHYGKYDIRLFSDFMHGGAKAEKIIKHDIALIFTSQNLEQSVNVIESLVSLHQQYNSKTRLLVFYDDERVVKLLSILGISVELVSTRIPLYSLQEKIQTLLESKEPGGIKMQKTRELSPAESDVIFNLLRGDSLLHIAQKRGTHPKTIFSQKYSAMKKLRLRSMSTIFVAGK
ncbi:DNA-binding transcriptional activator BglJ [Serratia quinivorans]|jgi:DNA-binding NarL/FixJ family response regulator|uniref:LuxR family transcriptional regulator n=2 Tax=Serratia TaxID=613 RepID=A0A5Q2V6H0_SERPR|nr:MULTISPECIES: LuxR family transcriptional regulator [Serratia]QGH59806.1 LuxR family transcriptional regulator [Serratia proteamaculans]CAI0759008.1 DNA-binding transcriptional activator BglJ [Serratia quinivorans]CAI0771204.1 DNA-binding transcriptional activator BglJ [Serratia quinivorans]CAI0811264.1 DNA-binding transcriptional activator BglJ [Serratia quinivorans]CAI0927360.1 DNA-binding transcriptional activator BglJ [Serratia quinivorans]